MRSAAQFLWRQRGGVDEIERVTNGEDAEAVECAEAEQFAIVGDDECGAGAKGAGEYLAGRLGSCSFHHIYG